MTPTSADKFSKGKCLNPECDRLVKARGFCINHYKRIARGQDPLAPRQNTQDVVQITAFRVRRPVAEALKKQAADSGVSLYELTQKIMDAWYAGYRKNRGETAE